MDRMNDVSPERGQRPHGAQEGEVPLSYAQQSLWFMAQLVPDHPFYNLPSALILRGLLVDDEEADLQTLSFAFGRHYEVFSASDGERALAMMQDPAVASRVQLVLSDQRMPNLNGVDFFRHLLEIAPDVVRILVTGYADMQSIIDSINKAHIYQFMLKPVDTDELLVTVRRALEAYDMRVELDEYHGGLERLVQQRTKELEQVNDDLRAEHQRLARAQDQLVIQEKMAFLGTLVAKYIDLTYKSIRLPLADARIEFENDFDEEVGEVPVSEVSFGRVLASMITNSCEALVHKQAKAGPEFAPRVRLVTRKRGELVEIRVWDNGVGIPEPQLREIFHPFFTTKASPRNIGLGLSIAYDIVVQEYGGRIEVRAREGEFTELIVRLPVRPLDA